MKQEREFWLYGIFGRPLAHTLSPAMQEAAFRHLGMKAHYLALDLGRRNFRKVIRCLPAQRRGISQLLLDGFNVTVPYKWEVMRYLGSRLTPEAKAIRAVNTVFRKNGRWWGANTDGEGFLTSLRREGRFHPRGKKILILGAGGSARAVAYGLAHSGVRQVMIVNRTAQRAKNLAREYQRLFPKTEFVGAGLKPTPTQEGLKNADLVVNATSVGLVFGEAPIPGSWIPKARTGRRKLFFDLVYHHGDRTNFLAAAKRKGHRILNGLGMLLYQGARSFELWTRKKAPVAVMRRALQRGVGAPLVGR